MRSRGAADLNPHLTTCSVCQGMTSRKYAREHQGRCKSCVTSTDRTTIQTFDSAQHGINVVTRNERILESGYAAYAREEGHYDNQE